MTMKSNIDLFFKKFRQSNSLIFAKLKETIKNEKTNLLSMVEGLKTKVKIYTNEEEIMKATSNKNNRFKK